MAPKLVVVDSIFDVDMTQTHFDFIWISGSREFIDSIPILPDTTSVFWMFKSPRRCPSNTPHIRWSRISHEKVGGVTEARATFGIDTISGDISLNHDLKRSLGHIVKYSIRPRVCDANPSEKHYTLSNLLSLSFPRKAVLYPTYMSRSGWGIRELTDLELSLCFELPAYVVWEDRFLRDIVPIQLFRSVMDSVVQRHLPAMQRPTKRIANPTLDDRKSLFDSVWLADIGKWLPGSWADADIADKAVKSDNAPVDFRPWHRRIQLVMPCSIREIGILECLATRPWRFNVCRSFFGYLKSTYGELWLDFAIAANRKRSSGDSLTLLSKRLKVSSSMSMKSKGGCTSFQRNHGRDVSCSGFFKRDARHGSGFAFYLVGMDVRICTFVLEVEQEGTDGRSKRWDDHIHPTLSPEIASWRQTTLLRSRH